MAVEFVTTQNAYFGRSFFTNTAGTYRAHPKVANLWIFGNSGTPISVELPRPDYIRAGTRLRFHNRGSNTHPVSIYLADGTTLLGNVAVGWGLDVYRIYGYADGWQAIPFQAVG